MLYFKDYLSIVTIKHLQISLKVSWDEYSNCYCNFSYFIGKLSTHSETLKSLDLRLIPVISALKSLLLNKLVSLSLMINS